MNWEFCLNIGGDWTHGTSNKDFGDRESTMDVGRDSRRLSLMCICLVLSIDRKLMMMMMMILQRSLNSRRASCPVI